MGFFLAVGAHLHAFLPLPQLFNITQILSGRLFYSLEKELSLAAAAEVCSNHYSKDETMLQEFLFPLDAFGSLIRTSAISQRRLCLQVVQIPK